jgi:sec-independent protein translocase protein TatC
MSLMEHLEELRARLIKAVAAYAIACVVAWFVYSPILHLLTRALSRLSVAKQILRNGELIYTAPTEAFFIRLKVTAFAALILALPVILWQAWRFVMPGLHPNEKRYALPFIVISMGLFALGGFTAYFTLPQALQWLTSLAGSELVLLPRASEYLSFVMLMIAAFGFAFEFPIALLALTMVGVLTSRKLRKGRRIAWVVILIIAAVITPTQDPITMTLLAIPMGILYEATVVTARLMKR